MAVFRRQTLAKYANKHGEVTIVYGPVILHCTIVSLIGSCVVTSLIGILLGCWLVRGRICNCTQGMAEACVVLFITVLAAKLGSTLSHLMVG